MYTYIGMWKSTSSRSIELSLVDCDAASFLFDVTVVVYEVQLLAPMQVLHIVRVVKFHL